MQYIYHLSHQRGNDFILPGSQKLVSVCPGSGPSTQELIMIWTHFFLKGRNLQSKGYSEHKIWLRVALRKPHEGCLYEEWSETGLLNHFSQYSYGIHNLEGNWRIVFVVQVSVPCITSPFRVEEYTVCVIAFHGNIINMSFTQGDNQINNWSTLVWKANKTDNLLLSMIILCGVHASSFPLSFLRCKAGIVIWRLFHLLLFTPPIDVLDS